MQIYDANDMIEAAHHVGAEAGLPPRARRKIKRLYDVDWYKERNLIESMFNKMKNFRRVAARYDKLDFADMAFILVSGIYLFLK